MNPDLLFACDLDRTLIYTARSVALRRKGDVAEPAPPALDALVCVERVHGEPLSFATAAVPGLLQQLGRHCRVVPVTTRSRGQYRRVELFTGANQPEWAVCANGGHLLHWGKPDQAWYRAMVDCLDASSAGPGEVARRLIALGDWVTGSRVADGLFAYALVDRAVAGAGAGAAAGAEAIADAIDSLVEWLDERGWVLSLQGRKIYAAPVGLDKWTAVQEVARRTGATHIAAAGDSILDRALLDGADFSVRPPHGELEAIGYPADVIVPVAGVVAGTDVLLAAIAWAEANGARSRRPPAEVH